MKSELQTIIEMSYSFSNIERDLYYPNRKRPENDAEHSSQLILIAWYIIETNKLKLDTAKIFKLCMAHDLVELYAGDVPLWGKKGHKEKQERENKALEILKIKLPNVSDITDTISEYKERKTDEAKFVYGLDKLLPFLNQLNTEGRIWKAHKITIERAVEKLETHALVSPYLTKYFEKSIKYLKKNKKRFFNV